MFTLPDVSAVAHLRGWQYHIAHAASVQRCDASRTTPETLADLLSNLDERIRADAHAALVPEVVHDKFSRLYTVRQDNLAETFRCAIPAAGVVQMQGVVVTPQAEILLQSIMQGGSDTALRAALVVPEVHPRPQPGAYVSLIAVESDIYEHWLIDSLPRLALLDALPDDYRVILPPQPRSFHLETLALLGIGAARLLPLETPFMTVEHLHFCHAAQITCLPHQAHLHAVSSRLLRAARVTNALQPHRRLYLSRAKTARQRIVNEADLLPMLRHYDFEIVVCEELSVKDQICLFAEAAVVMGAFGSATHNIIFCPSGAVMIELFNPVVWNNTGHILACLMGHQHWHLFGSDAGGAADAYIEPARLDALLRLALAGT